MGWVHTMPARPGAANGVLLGAEFQRFRGAVRRGRKRPEFIYARAMRDNTWATKLLRKVVTLE